MNKRSLHPELLDELPANDPLAIGSRRDLRWINALMGNARLMADAVRPATSGARPRRIVDLGAGDGAVLLDCVRRLPSLERGTELLLVDRSGVRDSSVLAALSSLGFNPRVIQADALEWLQEQPVESGTWVFTNLFLHHFTSESLASLFRTVATRADLLCACEPHRDPWSLVASKMLGVIGANAVTRHDATVSVRAGFQVGELSSLWPDPSAWQLREHRAGIFSQLFLAQRA